MDSILLILFGSLFVTMSSLTFIEVRRIRKKLLQPEADSKKAVAAG